MFIARTWRKLFQAMAGSVGLMGVFLAYRRNRRKAQFRRYRSQQLMVDASGVHWK